MKPVLVLVLLVISAGAFSQTNKEIALEKGKEAIKLMDEGKIAESITLLEECIKLDPERIDFPYEIGYAHYVSKEYDKVIEIMTKLSKRKDTFDRVFQLLGNSYDIQGKKEKAIEVYENGIKKFPESGKLYLELGIVYEFDNKIDKAIECFEKGMDVEPSYSSTYFRAANLFLNSSDEVWGMIYGEIFMNLERNSDRTSQMSKSLYDTYKSQITFTSDSSFKTSFSSNTIVMNAKKLELPFGLIIYEPILMLAVIPEKNIDLSSLDRIRTRFVENYFQNGRDKKYPNVLFEYQNTIRKEGHLEAYNYWILMKGDEDAFVAWREANADKWTAFIEWFKPNGIQIDKTNVFYRAKYD